MTLAIAASALIVSFLSLLVSFVGQRASGPRVRITSAQLVDVDLTWWLRIRVVNSGRSEVDIETASAERLGFALQSDVRRLQGGSSLFLEFRGPIPFREYMPQSITVQVSLGTGQTIFKRIQLDEREVVAGSARIASRVAANEAMQQAYAAGVRDGSALASESRYTYPPEVQPALHIDVEEIW